MIRDEQIKQSEQISGMYAHENQTTGSNLDPSETSHFRKYLFKSRNKKRITSEVQDPVFEDLLNNAATEKTHFQESRDEQLKALDLLFTECLSQVRAWSGNHADLIAQLSAEMKVIYLQRLQEATKSTDQLTHDLVKALASVTSELSRVQLENKRKDSIIKELLNINDHIQRNNELAIKLYSKADQERASQSDQLDTLRFSVLNWLPNFVKYSDQEYLLRQVVPILPNSTDLMTLGGTNFWHAQKLQVDYNDEQAMWGLERDDLADIQYRGEPLLQKYHISALWLRSDLCRIQKLLDVPTNIAVDLEQTQIQLKKSEKRNKRLGEEVLILKGNIEQMEERIQSLSAQNKKSLKELFKLREELKRAQQLLERQVYDKQTQTDVSGMSPSKDTRKVPGLIDKKYKSQYFSKRNTSSTTNLLQRRLTKYNVNQTYQSNESKQSEESIYSLSPERLQGLSKATIQRLIKKSSSQVSLHSSGSSSILKEFSSPYKALDLIPEVKKSLKVLSRMKSVSQSHQNSTAKRQTETLTHEQGILVKKQLGEIYSQNMWLSEIRFPDRVWQQFKPRYSEMQSVMHKLVARYPTWENALDLLWAEIGDSHDAKLKQVQDFYELFKHDWRAVLLIKVANLDFTNADSLAVKATKLRVSYNSKDCRASNLCARLLRRFNVNIDQAFAFQDQHQLMVADGIGKNPNILSPTKLVYLHDAFHAIASELQSKMLKQLSNHELSAPLLTYIHSQLKQKCVTVVVMKLGENIFPSCSIQESNIIKLDDQSTIQEYQFLDLIRTKLVQYQTNGFLRTLPLSTEEFSEVLQGAQFKLKFPERFNDAVFKDFCQRHILKGGDSIDNECLRSLEDNIIAYQLHYEDALLIGVDSIKKLDKAIETRLKPAFNRFHKKGKGQSPEARQFISIDQFKKTMLQLAGIKDRIPIKGRKETTKLAKINEMCNELNKALALKQIEGVDLPTFRRAFELLKISFKALQRLKLRPHPGLSREKTQMLADLKEYLENALQTADEPLKLSNSDNQINLEHHQLSLKIADYIDEIQIDDLRQLLFDENQVVEESSSSQFSSDIDSKMSPANVNNDLKIVQEQIQKVRPITIISQTPPNDVSFKVSDKYDLTIYTEKITSPNIGRYKSTMEIDYHGSLLDEVESRISKKRASFKKQLSLAISPDKSREMVSIVEREEPQTPLLNLRNNSVYENYSGLPSLRIIKRAKNKMKKSKPARLSRLVEDNTNQADGSLLRIISFKHGVAMEQSNFSSLKQKLPVNYAIKKLRKRLVSVEAAKDEPMNLFLQGSKLIRKQDTMAQLSYRNRTPQGIDMNIQTGKSLYESMTSMFPSRMSTTSNKKKIEAFVPKIN